MQLQICGCSNHRGFGIIFMLCCRILVSTAQLSPSLSLLLIILLDYVNAIHITIIPPQTIIHTHIHHQLETHQLIITNVSQEEILRCVASLVVKVPVSRSQRRFKPIQTYPNISKHIQTYPNVSKHIQSYPNISKHGCGLAFEKIVRDSAIYQQLFL